MKGSDEIARACVFKDGTHEAMTRSFLEPTPQKLWSWTLIPAIALFLVLFE